MKKIIFHKANIVKDNFNSIAVVFKIKHLKENANPSENSYGNSLIKVVISKLVLQKWQVKNLFEDEFLIKLVFPFAKQFIKNNVEFSKLEEKEKIILTKENAPFPYPYNLNEIIKTEGYEYIIEPDT